MAKLRLPFHIESCLRKVLIDAFGAIERSDLNMHWGYRMPRVQPVSPGTCSYTIFIACTADFFPSYHTMPCCPAITSPLSAFWPTWLKFCILGSLKTAYKIQLKLALWPIVVWAHASPQATWIYFISQTCWVLYESNTKHSNNMICLSVDAGYSHSHFPSFVSSFLRAMSLPKLAIPLLHVYLHNTPVR